MKRSAEEVNGQSKRQKGESESKVLHVRGIPQDTHESELQSLLSPFGTVVRSLIVGPKHQAFVELDSVSTAQRALAAFAVSQPSLRGNTIQLQYSSKTEVRPNPRYPSTSGIESSDGYPPAFPEEKAGPILFVVVLNARMPVTVDNLHQVFRTYGEVLRIVTFQKKNFQAFIEYGAATSAIMAKRNLEGKNLFLDCCTLHITFSSLTPPLQVKGDQTRARDYTQSRYPLQPEYGYGQSSPYGPPPSYGGPPPSPYAQSTPPYQLPPPSSSYLSPSGGDGGSIVHVRGLPTEGKVTCDMLFTLFGVYGDVMRVKIFWNKKDSALVQFRDPLQAAAARNHLSGVDFLGQKLIVTPSKNAQIKLQSSSKFTEETTKDYSDSKLHRFSKPGSRNERHICAPSTSLHVSNLPQDVNLEELRQYFSADDSKVLDVKLKGDTKKMAFVYYPTVGDAVAALVRFHGAPYGDHNIKVTFSHAKK
jgi:hnRNP-L/PTB/hephaestus splicing factor